MPPFPLRRRGNTSTSYTRRRSSWCSRRRCIFSISAVRTLPERSSRSSRRTTSGIARSRSGVFYPLHAAPVPTEVAFPVGVALFVLPLAGITLARRAQLASADPSLAKRFAVAAQIVGVAWYVLLLVDYIVGVWMHGTFWTQHGFHSGRPLRRGRRTVRPELVDRGPVPRQTAVPTGVVASWRESARDEAAAVVAFADLATDLVAVGAPDALVARARRAARDEESHVRLYTEAAASADGRLLTPADVHPRPRRRSRLRTLALGASDAEPRAGAQPVSQSDAPRRWANRRQYRRRSFAGASLPIALEAPASCARVANQHRALDGEADGRVRSGHGVSSTIRWKSSRTDNIALSRSSRRFSAAPTRFSQAAWRGFG